MKLRKLHLTASDGVCYLVGLMDDYRTPGQLIEALLKKNGWSMRVLAVVLDCDETAINRIVNGKKPVDAAMALALGEVFGVDAMQFLDLQKTYELAQARIVARPDPSRTTRAHLFGGLPIPEMIKRGWIDVDDVRNVSMVESALTKFFGAETLNQIEVLPHAAKKTFVSGDVAPNSAQVAWLHRVRSIAREMIVGKYSPDAARDVIVKLKALLASAEEARKVPRILAEAGIRYVLVEGITSAKIDGVCLWLNDKSPVVAMSLRHDRIDNFWFVLRHELEHVLRGHGKTGDMLDAELEGERAGTGANVPEEERVANQAAAEFCVPQDALARFIARKAPFFAERDILGFSRTHQIHPGLVAGQLQHQTGRSHQVKIRSIVAPGARVDGWGDIAPVEG